ncbi:MAG: pseudouridine synthase [Eubacteriales bacterium]|nr:rRNA pseudouridine synthase [Clostridiales bacterium]MDD6341554.1 pseudouridine synthase [Eubacteriales bacterium]MDD7392781.1 pseudouridine synthase [Eubacteriales bacterium]MDY3760580.1 pseudouridine synthase [Eubacteriales bacterium]
MKRLDAVLSACSVGSRSEVKALIRKGKVSVNGTVVRDVSFAVTDSDEVRVNGIVTDTSEFVYLMLNKPCGFVSTTDADEENVLSFVPSELFRKGMFPVGRLDKDTSGLIFLTNDGAFSHMLTSPSRHVEKEYIATLERPLDEICFEFFAEGMTLKDGFTTRPAKLERLGEKKARVVISEGKYHQVRRMFACCGNRVETLKRVRIGGVELDPTLEEGEVRKLTDEELDLLKT